MAKVIKYKFLSAEINCGTEEKPDMKQIFLDKSIIWSEANEAVAKREAWGGKYTVEDDGAEETIQPTTEERIADLEKVISHVRFAFEKIGISIE